MRTRRSWFLVIVLLSLWAAARTSAHPAPFSYLDLELDMGRLSGQLVLHDLDVAQVLGLTDPTDLMDPVVVAARADAIVTLVTTRVAIEVDGRPITWVVDEVAPVDGQDAVSVRWHAGAMGDVPARLDVGARLFPHDPVHQTFLTIREAGEVRLQDVLDLERDRVSYRPGSGQPLRDVFLRFVASGIHHLAIGPDHILFLIGLLLPGGRVGRLLAIITAFTVGHSITLVLATLGHVNPSPRIIEPLIALSIVFVGADNLLTGQKGRDVRLWVALGFGLIHGFGFASVLRDVGLPPRALGVSLFAFNLGVELGQAAIVLIVSSLLAWLRRRHHPTARHVYVLGSWVVVLAGLWWFLERVGVA